MEDYVTCHKARRHSLTIYALCELPWCSHKGGYAAGTIDRSTPRDELAVDPRLALPTGDNIMQDGSPRSARLWRT